MRLPPNSDVKNELMVSPAAGFEQAQGRKIAKVGAEVSITQIAIIRAIYHRLPKSPLFK
jgi:hypothetical protein